jgi:hypothetical protein
LTSCCSGATPEENAPPFANGENDCLPFCGWLGLAPNGENDFLTSGDDFDEGGGETSGPRDDVPISLFGGGYALVRADCCRLSNGDVDVLLSTLKVGLFGSDVNEGEKGESAVCPNELGATLCFGA